MTLPAELPEADLEQLQEAVAAALEQPRSPFLDNLVARSLRRYPPLEAAQLAADEESEGDDPEPVHLAEIEGGAEATAAFLTAQLREAIASPYFELARKVSDDNDSQAFDELMGTLDSQLRVKGIFYRHGLDPEQEYPGIFGRVWEAIPKWDGRDFRAYVARIVRNYCLDEIHRRKRTAATIEDTDPQESRPIGQTSQQVWRGEAIEFVLSVLDDLESSGAIKAIHGVIFSLICQGRQVADILEAFGDSQALPRLSDAISALELPGNKVGAEDATALGLLLDGLTGDEVGQITGRSPARLEEARQALGALADDEAPSELDEDRALAKLLVRDGMSVSELERARRLTANAVNLCINRIRLKMWMALNDRAYEAMRRRGRIDEVDLAIVAHRCTVATHSGCRMYKDRTCKRERDPAEVARLAGLDLSGAAVSRRMDDLRLKIIEEGLGQVFPDYNSCLNERKSTR